MKKFAFRYMVASGCLMAVCHGSGLGVYTICNLFVAITLYLIADIVTDIKKK